MKTTKRPRLANRHARRGGFLYHDVPGSCVALADGSTCFLPADISAEDMETLLTVDSVESVDPKTFIHPRFHWGKCLDLIASIASAILLMVWPRQRKSARDLPAVPAEE